MTVEEAKLKTCPILSTMVYIQDTKEERLLEAKCICDNCAYWITTINGPKEIARKKIPYDIYPFEEGQLIRQLKDDGYVKTIRGIYVKYEDAHEGYCVKVGNETVSKDTSEKC